MGLAIAIKAIAGWWAESEDKMQIVGTLWFTQAREPHTIGMVKTVDPHHGPRFYLGTVAGGYTNRDAHYIIDWGARMDPEEIAKFLELKTVSDG